MKTLIIYYSRTGHVKKIAEVLRSKLGVDIEEILPEKSYDGAVGWIVAGKEASQKALPKIKIGEKNPADYDLVIFGTPVWAWNISSPLRTYITKNKDKFKKISAFCTMGGQEGKIFEEIENICAKKLETKKAFTDKDILSGNINIELFSKIIL